MASRTVPMDELENLAFKHGVPMIKVSPGVWRVRVGKSVFIAHNTEVTA